MTQPVLSRAGASPSRQPQPSSTSAVTPGEPVPSAPSPAAPASVAAPDPEPPALAQPAVALPTLVRLGGLPVRAVPETTAAVTGNLEYLRRLDEVLDGAANQLLDPLYELIPTLAKTERRLVLRAKRRVFQGRATGLSDEVLQGLPAELRALLERWDALVARKEETRARLAVLVDVDLDRSRELLAAGLDEPGYQESLAIAAPALISTLTTRGRRLEDPRVLRTLYTLATRAALKTSPFSGLTTVNEAGQPAAGRSYRMVATHLAYRILSVTAQELAPDGALYLEPAPVRRAYSSSAGSAGAYGQYPPGEAEAEALTVVGEHEYGNGMVFRQETVQPARWLQETHDALTGGGMHAVLSVRDACERVGGADPRLRLERQLASGAVVPRVPWYRGENPFPLLAATLSPDQQHRWGRDLAWLARLDEAVGAADGPTRADLLNRTVRLAERVFPDGELGERPSGFLYEDRESARSWADPLDDAPFAQDVQILGELADPWVARSHIYDLMVARFVSLFGSGGVCKDPLAFFMTIAHAPDGDEEMLRAAGLDYAAGPDTERAAMPGGLSGSPRHLGAFLQPVAPSARTYAAGGGLTVVNAFTNANGSLQARFHRLLGSGFRERLASRIRTAWGTERVLEIQASTECNTGQAVSCGLLPPLGLPDEPGAPDAVPLSSLRLVHDPATSTLFLADDAGPVGLAYLGLTPQYLLGGYLSWLVLLSDPWSRLPSFADHWTSRRRDLNGPLPDEVLHSERAVAGRLVTRRESWTFPAAQIAPLMDRDLTTTLLHMDDLRKQWGMPVEVFVHQHMPSQGATFDQHKPRYVDLTSPVSLLALRGWIDPGAAHISFVEALPARGEALGLTQDGEPTVAEYLVGLQWPKNLGGMA